MLGAMDLWLAQRPEQGTEGDDGTCGNSAFLVSPALSHVAVCWLGGAPRTLFPVDQEHPAHMHALTCMSVVCSLFTRLAHLG
jgi:hypothetical protein